MTGASWRSIGGVYSLQLRGRGWRLYLTACAGLGEHAGAEPVNPTHAEDRVRVGVVVAELEVLGGCQSDGYLYGPTTADRVRFDQFPV